jgi:hypothetical protein
MAERYDTKKFDGMKFDFYIPENADGCMKCMFGCFTCCTYSGQGTIKVIDDNTMQMHSMSFAGGLIRPSPIPCCMCCGFGPLAVVAPMARDETDPNKWVGNGSICAGGCCPCMHNTGDSMIFDANHDGSTPDKYGTIVGGNNWSSTPPCWAGKETGAWTQKGVGKPAFKGGAPASNEMAR